MSMHPEDDDFELGYFFLREALSISCGCNGRSNPPHC